MNREFTSLSGQLSFSILVWVCGFWVASTLAVGWYVHTEIAEGFDNALSESAVRLLELAAHELEETRTHPAAAGNSVSVVRGYPVVDASLQSSYSPSIGEAHTVYQLLDSSGRVLMKSANAPTQALGAPLVTGFYQTSQWRIFTVAQTDRSLYLQIADPVRHRIEARNESLVFLTLPLLAILPMLGLLVHRAVRAHLVPLDSLSVQLRQRSGKNLEPVGVQGMPDELVSTVDSVNQLLLRLQDALQTERSLSANAAHELRTPLTVAQLRLANSLALELSPVARAEICFANDALTKLSRRTEKLLQLSRAESGAGLARDKVLLHEVVLAVLQEFEAESIPIHLLSDASAAGVQIDGDFDSIAIALRNLIENSVRYGQGSAIEIEINTPGELIVRDYGRGVNAELLGDLASRHVRHSTDSAGFGLGLSIVKTIVERHGGQLRFVSPPTGKPTGFEVSLSFSSGPFRQS
ncbi:MAG: two-component sensor histidine kinase [Burkholderiales bacterium PBB3]|nr:MAG: two-component sensor histidine kinase [Burkholderiales bacterium PBB3]